MRHPAGVAHRCVFLMKGAELDEWSQFHSIVDKVNHDQFAVPDIGFDIGSYFRAGRSLPFEYLVFLNSFSRILSDGWLDKMLQQLNRTGVGAVGATGSWESRYTNARDARHNHLAAKVVAPLRAVALSRQYYQFPNYHLRTNAFMIRRDIWNGLHQPCIVTKQDAHRYEAGRRGLTSQLGGMGLRVLVVGADGTGYEKEAWPSCGSFRSSDQENLLVSDNQTDAFRAASAERRQYLQSLAWGV